MLESGKEFVHGVWAKCIADLWAVESHAYRAVLNRAVIGDISEIKAWYLAPCCWIENIRDF